MRKAWLARVLLLCMACLICVGGLCSAKDKDKLTLMWEFELDSNYPGEKRKFYIDDNATQIIDYEGRKYLQVYIQINKVFFEQIWFVPTWREGEKGHWTRIYDIENRKAFTLEYFDTNEKPKKGSFNISTMKQNCGEYNEFDQKFIQWMETNRKSVLDEIRRANGGNQGTSGNAGQPAVGGYGSNQGAVSSANIKIERLEDGGVRYRSEVDEYGNLSENVVSITPESLRDLLATHGAQGAKYALLSTYKYAPDQIQIDPPLLFNYHPDTGVFDVYGLFLDELDLRKASPYRFRFIDKNTVEVKEPSGISDRYVHVKVPWRKDKKEEWDKYDWVSQYKSAHLYDDYVIDVNTPVSIYIVDGLLAFLSVNGDVGEVSSEIYAFGD